MTDPAADLTAFEQAALAAEAPDTLSADGRLLLTPVTGARESGRA
ncbi:hypothetical protein [Nonomuraea sp. NPDC049400]